ncbi:MAG: amidohydrolase [Balneolia bacterium]|nr:amidohydrolase [Balneolia bacterium]
MPARGRSFGSNFIVIPKATRNVKGYADFSGLVLGDFTDQFERYMKEQLENMMQFAGDPRYLLFGTDWPKSSMKSYVKFMDLLELNDETKDLIRWKNAARLFKIDVDTLLYN